MPASAKLQPFTTPSAPALRVMPDPVPAAPSLGGGLNFGSLGLAAPAAKGGKAFPVADLDADTRAVVTQLLEEKAQYKALEGSIAALNRIVVDAARPCYFSAVGGQADALSSIIAPGTDGTAARVTFTSRYLQIPDAAGIVAAIGAERAAAHFTTGVQLKLDLEKVADDQRQPLVDALLPIFAQFGAGPAVTVKQVIVPRPGFHALRYRTFAPEENAALDAAIPMVVSITAK